MHLSGRPLFDNPLDAELFVPREEVERLERNSDEGINTLLFGEPGSGKTSLLRNLLLRLRERRREVLWVDGAFADSALDLLHLIGDGIRDAQEGEMPSVPLPLDSSESAEMMAAMRGLRSRLFGAERFVVLLDLAPGGLAPHDLFGRFRDEVWQIPLTWIVAAPTNMRAALTTPPADVFFEDVIELGPLSPEQQQDLIRRRLTDEEATPWRLPEEGEGNPRRLLQIVRESIRTGTTVDAQFLARSIREGEVAAHGHAAKVAYEYLEENGPTSASDDRLLAQLNWSRQRAARVLSELEDAGLVRGATQQGDHGRPRKLFAIIPPSAR